MDNVQSNVGIIEKIEKYAALVIISEGLWTMYMALCTYKVLHCSYINVICGEAVKFRSMACTRKWGKGNLKPKHIEEEEDNKNKKGRCRKKRVKRRAA
jgi:hypothetical protein